VTTKSDLTSFVMRVTVRPSPRPHIGPTRHPNLPRGMGWVGDLAGMACVLGRRRSVAGQN